MVLPNSQAKITDFMKKAYLGYFGVKLADQDKPFAPQICIKTCVENLRDSRNGKRKSLPFAIPMVWREGKDQITDCYFCMINLKSIHHKNKHRVQYPDIPSAIRPIPHVPDLPVLEPDSNMEYSSDSEHRNMTLVAGNSSYVRKGRPAITLDTSRIQQSDMRPEPFKGVCSADGFTSHPLVEPNKVLLSPLHIKLGVMTNFLKAKNKEGSRFAFLQKFPQISMEKLKADKFDGSQIKELIKTQSLTEH